MYKSFSAAAQSTWAHREHITHMTQSSPLESSENFLSQNIHQASSSLDGETPGRSSNSDVPEKDRLFSSSVLDSFIFFSKFRHFFTNFFPFLEGSTAEPRPRED
jgi:hypothetical protein